MSLICVLPRSDDKRFDFLVYDKIHWQREELVPQLLDKAVRAEQKTVYKTHLTYIDQCAKYGKAARALIEASVREQERPSFYVIERIETPQKNVTPIGGAA